MTAPSTAAGRALRATDPALAEYGIHHWDACNGLVDDYWLKCDCGLVQAITDIEAEAAAQALADAVEREKTCCEHERDHFAPHCWACNPDGGRRIAAAPAPSEREAAIRERVARGSEDSMLVDLLAILDAARTERDAALAALPDDPRVDDGYGGKVCYACMSYLDSGDGHNDGCQWAALRAGERA